jgi:hypothetical protein
MSRFHRGQEWREDAHSNADFWVYEELKKMEQRKEIPYAVFLTDGSNKIRFDPEYLDPTRSPRDQISYGLADLIIMVKKGRYRTAYSQRHILVYLDGPHHERPIHAKRDKIGREILRKMGYYIVEKSFKTMTESRAKILARDIIIQIEREYFCE